MPVTSAMIGSFKSNINVTLRRLEELRKEAQSENRELRVIDVGGGHGTGNDGFGGYSNAIIDLSVPENPDTKIDYFCVDLEDELSWQAAEAELMKNGKYDFAICRHTLEDLNNPNTAARWLQKIAKEGVVGVPVYTTELGRQTEGHLVGNELGADTKDVRVFSVRGYTHHRWIFFSGKNGELVAYPKMAWTDSFPDEFWEMANVPKSLFGDFFNNEMFPQDLSFFWKDDFSLVTLNPSLKMELQWGNKDVINKFIGGDIIKMLTGNGVDIDLMQDWVFLSILCINLGFTTAEVESYNKAVAAFRERWYPHIAEHARNPERFPWYNIAHLSGWQMYQNQKELEWLDEQPDGSFAVNLPKAPGYPWK